MDNNNNNNNRRSVLNFLPYIFVALFLFMMGFSSQVRTSSTALTYKEFNKLLTENKINSAKVSMDYNTMTVTGTFKQDNSTYQFSVVIPNTEKAADELVEELKAIDNVTFIDANASIICLNSQVQSSH